MTIFPSATTVSAEKAASIIPKSGEWGRVGTVPRRCQLCSGMSKSKLKLKPVKMKP